MSTKSPQAETLSNTGRRVRTSKPKVRSGCITCKARRIKCDEIKPSCERCTRFGRECGGYKSQLTYEERLASRNKQNLLPKLDVAPQPEPLVSAPQRLGLNLGLTAPQVFCVEASLELCRVLDLPHWTSTNLHICKQHPFIRHAFSAIRMLSKIPSARSNYDPSIALLAPIDTHLQAPDQNLATLHHECFLERARAALPNGFSDPDQTRLAAIVCLLTICLETLQFHHEPGLSHIQLGQTLINQLSRIHSSPTHIHDANTLTTDVQVNPNFIRELTNVFRMLEEKACALDSCFPLYAPIPLGYTSPFVNPFTELQIFSKTELIPSYEAGEFSNQIYDNSPCGSRDSSVSTL